MSDKKININFNRCIASNNFLKNYNSKPTKFKLILTYELKNFIIKLSKKAPIELIKPKFNWIKCYEPEDHLDALVKKIITLKILNNNSKILGYSFKDISTVERFKVNGFKNATTLDPKKDLRIKSINYGVETIEKHFNNVDFDKKFKNSKADFFIVRHTIEHCYNIKKFLKQIKKIITKNSYVLFEFPDCNRYFKNFDYTMLWEEHTYYFTSETFENLLLNTGFKVVFKKNYKYPLEDSIVFLVKLSEPKIKRKLFFRQNRMRLLEDFKKYKSFLKEDIKNTRNIFLKYKKKFPNNKITMYGAGHFTSIFISVYEIQNYIDYIIDDDLNKIKYYFPTGKIKIVSSSILLKKDISICILGIIPNNQSKVLQKNKRFLKYGKFFSIFNNKSKYIMNYKKIEKLISV